MKEALNFVVVLFLFCVPSAFAQVCDRSDAVVNNLEEQIGKPCEEITSQDLATITDMNLSGKSISSLRAHDFWDLKKLNYVNLMNNRLTTLPMGLFSTTPLVETIYIMGNKITDLPQNLFWGLKKLTNLGLDRNQLNDLPPDLLKDQLHFESLGISRNHIQVVPDTLKHLMIDDLTVDGGIDPIGYSQIKLVSSLSVVEVMQADLDRLLGDDHLVATAIPHLVGLNLWGKLDGTSSITTVTENNLSGFSDLRLLSLNNFRNFNPTAEMLRSVPDLTFLAIGYTYTLQTVPQDLFSNTPHLQYISLNVNKLTTLPPGIFSHLPDLNLLDLNQNQFSDMERSRIRASLPSKVSVLF